MAKKIILHLCADIGSDSRYYQLDKKYKVIRVGKDIGVENFKPPKNVYGILANPVCTEFQTVNRYGKVNDTEAGMFLVNHCLRIIKEAKPKWWVLENPARGELKKYLGEPVCTYQPWQYGSPWTKATALWGNFVMPPPIYNSWEDVPKNTNLYTRPSRPKPSLAFLHKSAIQFMPEYSWCVDRIVCDADLRSLCSDGFASAFKETNSKSNRDKISGEKIMAKKDKKLKKDKSVKQDKKQSNKVDSKPSKKTPATKAVQNVFTSLGLEPKHRAVPFQLVRHYDEVTVARNREQFPYEAEIQLDSTFCAVVRNKGVTTFWSRTGAEFQHLEVLGKAFKVKADGVYMCEVYVASEVMPCAKFAALFSPFRKNALTAPQQAVVDDKAFLVMNDFITIEEFTTGKSELPYSKRKSFLKKMSKKILKGKKSRFAVPATNTCNSEEQLRDVALRAISAGNKGINIRGEDNRYVCGHQNFHYLQIVEGATHNLTCVGFEEGTGKTEGQVASLLFTYKDDTEVKVPLGRTYSDEDSINMLKVLKSDGKGKKKKAKKGKKVKTASSPLGYVWEVNALEESTKGVMKNPTVGNFTKSKADF